MRIRQSETSSAKGLRLPRATGLSSRMRRAATANSHRVQLSSDHKCLFQPTLRPSQTKALACRPWHRRQSPGPLRRVRLSIRQVISGKKGLENDSCRVIFQPACHRHLALYANLHPTDADRVDAKIAILRLEDPDLCEGPLSHDLHSFDGLTISRVAGGAEIGRGEFHRYPNKIVLGIEQGQLSCVIASPLDQKERGDRLGKRRRVQLLSDPKCSCQPTLRSSQTKALARRPSVQ